MADRGPVLRLAGVRKSYNVGTPVEVEVLHGIDLLLEQGEFVALIGPSGSGKSTLLNIIGLLDRPTAGKLWIEGQETSTLGDSDITRLRGHSIGFVFQYHYLISAFTALENVMMPMLADRGFPNRQIADRARQLIGRVGLDAVADHPATNMSGGQQQRVAVARALAMQPDLVLADGVFPDDRMRMRAHELLDQVGLAPWENNLATNMSGGQQQRVAIARSLAMSPALILADEPTGNLDTKSADGVFEMMRKVNREHGTTFLIVTHNLDLARRCDRIVEVVDGRVRTALEEQAG